MMRLLLVMTLIAVQSLCARAQDMVAAKETSASRFSQQSGEALYRAICQGCHMPDGKGAVGAGAYPALANNQRLVAPTYPLAVVVNGRRAMPRFGADLNDQQVAAVVNFVRSHFGNSYTDKATAADVAALRSAVAR